MIVAINKIDKAEADIVSFDKNLLHFPVQWFIQIPFFVAHGKLAVVNL